MNNNTIYRRAEIKDFLKISELDRNGWSENRVSEFIPDGEHIWRFWVEYTSVFVAEYNSEIVGFANLFKANDKDVFLFHKIVVSPRFRNKSIGQNLFKMICSECDRYHYDCYTTVDPANERMLHICDQYEFADRNFIQGYYRDNEDRYLIKRKYKQ